jgi:hypothetical protein
MNASKLFVAIAAVAFAGSAFASGIPATGAAISAAAAAAPLTVAAKSLNVPNILVDASAGASRAQVRAEAVEAVKNYRSTSAAQFAWLSN